MRREIPGYFSSLLGEARCQLRVSESICLGAWEIRLLDLVHRWCAQKRSQGRTQRMFAFRVFVLRRTFEDVASDLDCGE
jgi:hypothetical protein